MRAALPTAPDPEAMRVTADGAFLYVVHLTASSVSTLAVDSNTGALSLRATLPYGVDMQPKSLVIATDQRAVFVGNRKDLAPSVSVFSRDQVTGELAAPSGPYPNVAGSLVRGLATNPAGTRIYTANWHTADLNVFDIDPTTATLTPFAAAPTIATLEGPLDLAFDAAGTHLYVGNDYAPTIGVHDVRSDGTLGPVVTVPAGATPVRVLLTPNGAFLYAVNYGGSSVSTYRIPVGTGPPIPMDEVPAGMLPGDGAMDPAGEFLAVSNFGSSDVILYRIDQATGALTVVDRRVVCSSGAASVAMRRAPV